MILITLLAFVLTACATNKYPDTCDVREHDKHIVDGKVIDGPGYTKGYFACRLEHHDGAKQEAPK